MCTEEAEYIKPAGNCAVPTFVENYYFGCAAHLSIFAKAPSELVNFNAYTTSRRLKSPFRFFRSRSP